MPEPLYTAVVETDAASGQEIIILERGGESPLRVKIAPRSGANLFSIIYEGRELLYLPENLDKLPGFRYGTPVLYPAPNRVAGGKFPWQGREFDWGLNDGDRFLHALVHSVAWEFEQPVVEDSRASVLVYLDFSPGTRLYELFGFDHRFGIEFSVDSRGVGFEYTVENRDSLSLPYGFAIHPYFIYHEGGRKRARLTVPATGHMEAVDLMPTGEMASLPDGGPFDLTVGRELSTLDLDDVFIGMVPEKPAVIEYSQAGIRIALTASAEFTHMVV
ncbi:MAG: aldose 1-epimerase, partial [Gemmatimonadota bacterium]|nr:aldose 1-epimerase [Gemmatimonadota bacterium]